MQPCSRDSPASPWTRLSFLARWAGAPGRTWERALRPWLQGSPSVNLPGSLTLAAPSLLFGPWVKTVSWESGMSEMGFVGGVGGQEKF